jgi:hypothetical protein
MRRSTMRETPLPQSGEDYLSIRYDIFPVP